MQTPIAFFWFNWAPWGWKICGDSSAFWLRECRKIVEKLPLEKSEPSHNLDIVENLAEHTDVKSTVSIGVTDMLLKDQLSDVSKRRDDALYVVKNNGRNQFVVKTAK